MKDPLIINGKIVPLLDEKTIGTVEFDIIIVGGLDVEMSEVMKEAARLGLDEDKIVLDRTICVPDFTLEKYKQLRHSQLSIISLVCWGGLAYHLFGLPFTSPTINLWFEEREFIKLLRDPQRYFDKELRFLKKGLYEGDEYPIFFLGDVKVHMNHYTDVEFARTKWEERRLKINWFNLLVMMHTDTPEILKEFDQLPYGKKVCFTSFETKLNSGYYIDPKYRRGLPHLVTTVNNTARNIVKIYDMWDMLLYGKKTPLRF